jgi:uncharacterized protein YndB with AHSA1/START domain
VKDAIVQSVVVGASREALFRLLVEPDQLVRWWPDVAELEPRHGGRVHLVMPATGSIVEGRVYRFDPPAALGFTWTWPHRPGHELQVDFTIDELGDGRSRVTVAHSGWAGLEELRRRHDGGWAHFLGCLRDLAEGRPVDKSFDPS